MEATCSHTSVHVKEMLSIVPWSRWDSFGNSSKTNTCTRHSQSNANNRDSRRCNCGGGSGSSSNNDNNSSSNGSSDSSSNSIAIIVVVGHGCVLDRGVFSEESTATGSLLF